MNTTTAPAGAKEDSGMADTPGGTYYYGYGPNAGAVTSLSEQVQALEARNAELVQDVCNLTEQREDLVADIGRERDRAHQRIAELEAARDDAIRERDEAVMRLEQLQALRSLTDKIDALREHGLALDISIDDRVRKIVREELRSVAVTSPAPSPATRR